MSIRSLTMLALAAGLALSVPAMGQNEKPKAPAATPAAKQPAAAKPTEEGKTDAPQDLDQASATGAEHIELAKTMVGDWTTETSIFVDPAHPIVTKGKAKLETVFGIRFVRQTFTGEMMGKAFKGEGLFGFNTATKEYECTWIDNSATGIMTMTGKKDAKGDLVFTGQADSTASGQKTGAKAVLHHEGKEKMTYTSYETGSDGKEVKMIEVVYTRAMPVGRSTEKKEDSK